MTKILAFGLLMLCYTVAFPLPVAESADDRLSAVKDAISRSICREVYWEEAGYHLGVSRVMEVKLEGSLFYVWIDDLMKIGGRDRVASSFAGRIKNGIAMVTAVGSYNVDSKPSPIPEYFTTRRKFEKGAIKGTITTPAQCPLRIDPPTPEKTRMVETVVSTYQKALSEYTRLGIASYPREVTIIIADFNVDYPDTYVLIDRPGRLEMDLVYLHHPDDWDSYEYGRDGAYLLVNRRIGPEHKELLVKIRQHGIIRKIAVNL